MSVCVECVWFSMGWDMSLRCVECVFWGLGWVWLRYDLGVCRVCGFGTGLGSQLVGCMRSFGLRFRLLIGNAPPRPPPFHLKETKKSHRRR